MHLCSSFYSLHFTLLHSTMAVFLQHVGAAVFSKTATKSGGPTFSSGQPATVGAANKCVQTAQLTCHENLTCGNFLQYNRYWFCEILPCKKNKKCGTVLYISQHLHSYPCDYMLALNVFFCYIRERETKRTFSNTLSQAKVRFVHILPLSIATVTKI